MRFTHSGDFAVILPGDAVRGRVLAVRRNWTFDEWRARARMRAVTLRFVPLDRRSAVGSAVVGLAVGALALGIEAGVTHHAKASERSRVREAAGRAQALAADLRSAAAQRAEDVTHFPRVRIAFARHDAGVLSRFAADHRNIAFALPPGATIGTIERGAVVQRLQVAGLGTVIAGVLPSSAQLAALQAASHGVRVSYVVDGIRTWPSGDVASADDDVTAIVPFPAEGP